jgi:glycosyltransferase involved in cell wall biosynthesis
MKTGKRGEKKICLCMIVKNESAIIERCLNGAKPIIDYVSICDTGSSDNTVELIENWCSEHNIPGTMHFAPFKNFGYNRTLAAKLAQQTYPDADYLLLLDADMLLEVDSKFDKSSLDSDQYLTMQYNSQIKFWLPRLLKASLPWHSVGVTHEYWDLDRSRLQDKTYMLTSARLEGLPILDHEDGGSRDDKFERDKMLLLQGHEDPETPDDLKIRYKFYLAQTYNCLDELEEAIQWYKRRIEAGGWAEEVYYSLLQIGFCYERLSNKAAQGERREEEQFYALALLFFQKAWEYRPLRAESLYQLARIHRERGNHQLGLMYALKGKEIPYPKEDLLFVDYHVYDYLFDYEISICAYYIEAKFQLGRKAQKRLMNKVSQLPVHIAEAVRNNEKFYNGKKQ